MKISTRLKECAKFVTPFRKVADVGTDHALLPIYLIKEDLADEVIASDVREGPLSFAKKNVMSEGIKSIKIVLSDGIKHISNDTEVVIISGMGGKLISDIISDDLLSVKRLILQPNMGSDILRRKLQSIGFKIVNETFVKDNKIHYEVIVADRGIMELSSKEEVFGPINILNKTELFTEYWSLEVLKLEKNLKNIPKEHENYLKLSSQIDLIKEEL